jgi:hypothetical protein
VVAGAASLATAGDTSLWEALGAGVEMTYVVVD